MGCPGVREYTQQKSYKNNRESKNGQGAWTKNMQNRDKKRARSGIIPRHKRQMGKKHKIK